MFHRALPEVEGFGVITSTPGLIRLSQPVMCFGLPLRTTSPTTESLEMPCSALASQLLATIPSLTSRVISGVVENATTSAGWPESTARLCDPDAPNDSLNPTPLPAEVRSNAPVSASYAFFGVEYATSASCASVPFEELPLPEALALSDEPPQPAIPRPRAAARAAAAAPATLHRRRCPPASERFRVITPLSRDPRLRQRQPLADQCDLVNKDYRVCCGDGGGKSAN